MKLFLYNQKSVMKLTNALFLSLHFISAIADILVTISDGTIRGRKEYSERGISFYAFEEIPYAKPPVGDLRFRDPQPVEKWKGILNATTNTKACITVATTDPNVLPLENEDCLYLNVYTPKYPSRRRSLPVIYFIFGGGFVDGAANLFTYGPHYLMEHDVIFVSVNYRIGPFGFVSTGDTVIPGNYGLKDQQMGLKWVKNNIKYFGGDPKKVTMYGFSAGAASAIYQLMNKGSNGLYRGVIAESGTALSPFSYQRDHKKNAYKLAAAIDPNFNANSSSQDLLKFLKSVSATSIKSAAASFPMDLRNDQIIQGFFWTPVIEPKHETAFITENMYAAVENGHLNRVPLIIGMCDEEVLFKSKDPFFNQNLETIDNDLTLLVNRNMRLTDENQMRYVGEVIRNVYTTGRLQDNPGPAIRFFSDTGFTRGLIRHAQLQSRYSDVYFYQFSYYGSLPGDKGPFFEDAGKLSHGEDVVYIIALGNRSNLNDFPQDDILTSNRYRTLYTNFVKYLNPTPRKSKLLQNIIWPKVKPDHFQYLNINNTLSIKKNPRANSFSKWLEIYEKYAVKPYDTF